MEDKKLAVLLIAIIAGPVLSLLVTPVFCLLRKIFYVPFIRKKLLNKAVRKGHVATAKLLRASDSMEERPHGYDASGQSVGLYRYEYAGKQYKRRMVGYNMPEELQLYFQRKPSKAVPAESLGSNESNWLLYYVIISVIFMIAGAIYGVNFYA